MNNEHLALLRAALPYLEDTCDEGPPFEGWKSDALSALIGSIYEAMEGQPA